MAARDLSAARDYARQQRLSSGLVAQIVAYRRARHYGLHVLPPGLGLDGLVLDVGANRGDFAAVVRQLEPNSRVVCVEPVPSNAAHLRERFGNGVQVHELALSDSVGTSTLNVTATTEFASLHAPAGVLSAYAGAHVVDRPIVATSTLDTLVDGDVRVLKIDVQGHETNVLRGAAATLKRTAVVLIEVLFVSHYDGDSTFGDIDGQMRLAGFDLVGLEAPANPPRPLMWGDACYIKRAAPT